MIAMDSDWEPAPTHSTVFRERFLRSIALTHISLFAIYHLRKHEFQSILLVEQNVKAGFKISKRIYVMKAGHIIQEEAGQKLLERGEWWDLF